MIENIAGKKREFEQEALAQETSCRGGVMLKKEFKKLTNGDSAKQAGLCCCTPKSLW